MLLLWFLLFYLSPTDAKFYKTNVTDFSKCKVYYSRSGSTYKDFFEITDTPQNGTLLDFHFAVISPSDAHILLAPSSVVDQDDPVYEIVIGAGGNTFCDIRRKKKSAVRATVRLKGLLSSLDVHSFWIHITQDGVISVGKEGEELGFITWTDPDPLPLKVFSFSTWSGVEAKWYYDCPREDNSTEHSKEIKNPMTALEQLRKDLLFFYDPYVRPVYNLSTITVVGLQLSTTTVNLDEHKALIYYTGTATMTWLDEKLHWNASAYNGLDELHIFRREIWIPNLYLFDFVGDGSDILQDTLLTVNSTGHVTWRTTIKTNSWCVLNGLNQWPRDEHSCDILISFITDFRNLKLVFNANQSSFSSPYSSTWAIFEVKSSSHEGWENFEPPWLTLQLKLRRTSTNYDVIFFTPFIVIMVSVLMTFWVSPFGFLKFGLICLQLLLNTVILLVLGYLVPIHSQLVPNLVLLYSYCLAAITLCIFLEVIVINLTRRKHASSVPHFLKKILVSCFFKMFLCLPELKLTNEYGNLNEPFSKRKENFQAMWILLGVAIDRIAFFVYLGFAFYAICVSY